MSYTTIPTSMIQVGKAVKKELLDLIKSDLDDHETRLNALSVGSGPVILFNEDIYNVSSTLTTTGVLYYKATANFNLTKAQIQIYTKDGISSGLLEVDLKKATTLGGTYTSIFTTKPSVNYATASTYAIGEGTFNAGQAVNQDNIIRLDITNIPSGYITKFRLMVYGVYS